jgi:hypothetical protein
MIPRRPASLLIPLLALPVVLALAGCSKLQSITIQPAAGSVVLTGIGQTAQFTAIGTSQMGNAEPTTGGVSANWSVSNPNVATVTATGLVTAKGPGYTQVFAESNGVTAASDITVNVSAAATVGLEPLLSLSIIPSSITVGNLQSTGQFLAIGTFSTPPYVRDLTNSPDLTWISTFPNDFPVGTNSGGNSGASAGLVTAYAGGTVNIIAEWKDPDPTNPTIQTAQATFNCPFALATPTDPGSCVPGTQVFSLLATLTIYNEGLNTTAWEITGASATGTPNVIDCGPVARGKTGGSVCTATYPFGASVVLKATGGAFGGWSYNCTPSNASGVPLNPVVITAAGPNYCAITFSPAVYVGNTLIQAANSNVSIGAIFN